MPDTTCRDCGGPRNPKASTKGGRCRPCSNKARTKPRPTCSQCGAAMGLNSKRKGTLCLGCNARHIGRSTAAKASRTIRARLADPVIRAERSAKVRAYCSTPEGRAQREAEGQRRAALAIAWCPEAYRPLYADLRKKGFLAADAKALVIAKIETDKAIRERQARQWKRPMTFAEQLAAVQGGARLVPAFVPPAAEPTFTLAGTVGEIA